MDLAPDKFDGSGGDTPFPALLQQEQQRRQWLLEIWSYTAFMAVALSLVGLLLTGDLLLMMPVVFVCLTAGAVGTILAIQRSRLTSDKNTSYESMLRK